ncbi:cation-translocating P-type ATPase, partial [uncultured Clostridium sp.]|uniref:heavy metal translocating P-type ATPase n=1 Tax=uncultured Clostridium sp. TaxID=59620 RepID=UPI0025EAFEC3
MEQTISYKIIGMTCMLCSSEIENKIKKLKGIKNVDVNYSTETAIVVHDKEMCSSDEIRNCITSLGFYIDDEQGKGSAKYIQNLKNKVILSFIFTVPLMIAMLLCNVESCCVIIDPNYESSVAQITAILRYKLYFLHSWKVQMILAAIVQFILGRKFYKNALASILNRKLGMDLLVSLGSISTFAYSIYCVYKNNGEFGNQLYFESGAMMISFILLGKYLEALAKRRTNNTLNSLKKMQDDKVIVEISNGDIEKDVKNIKVDDVVIITPGQQIPLDGIIIEGESSIDESLITGESMAVLKKVGDKVFGGTINTYGSFKFKVERTIDEGFL